MPIDVAVDRVDGAEMILLNVEPDVRRFSFWLDPARGFMIVRRSCRVGTSRTVSTFTVLSSTMAANVWIPERAIRRQELENDPEASEFVYDVRFFRIGTVHSSDVSVSFPPDSRVFDNIRKIEYRLQPDGKVKLLPLADFENHTLRMPPQQNIVPDVDAKTAEMYTKQPLLLASHQPRQTLSPGRRFIYLVINLLFVAAVVFIFIVRRRAAARSVHGGSTQ